MLNGKNRSIITAMKRDHYYRIALLASSDANEFTSELLRGIHDELEQRRAAGGKSFHLCLFDGDLQGWKKTTGQNKEHIFNQVHKADLDGILIPRWLIGRFDPQEDLPGFIRFLSPIPFAIIGMDFPGSPSVLMDNFGGMRKLVNHMVEEHGIRKPLLLTGPADHGESNSRIEGFLDSLKEHGIPFPEENLLRGDFNTLSAYRAVDQICRRDPQLKSWDALFCLNDNMAYGAIKELQIRGFRIPEDLAVTGFDNGDFAISVLPQITTLSNPFYESCRIATEGLLASINGEKKIPLRTLRGNLIVRNSCGCGKSVSDQFQKAPFMEQSFDGSDRDYLSPEQEAVSHRLFLSLQKGVQNRDYGVFQREIRSLLQDFKLDSNRPFHQSIFNYLQERADRELDSSYSSETELLLGYLHQQVQGLRIIQERSRFMEYKDTQEHFQQLQEALRNSRDISMLRKSLVDTLEGIHISHLYIVRFYPGKPGERLGEMILTYRDFRELDSSNWPLFPVDQLLPEDLWSNMGEGLTLLTPLNYYDEKLGYAIYHTERSHLSAARWLSQQLSNVLARFDWMDEMRAKNQYLEESLTALNQTRERLIESDRLAALGEMVGGIAHEINGPVGVGITLSTHLKDLLQEPMLQVLAHGEGENLISRFEQGLELLYQNLDRAAGLIRNYKMVAVDQSSEKKREYPVHSYIGEVIATMRSEWKHHRIDFQIEGCENLILEGYPGLLSQIINHLVSNSIHHGFPEKRGTIAIGLALKESRLVIDYKDDGVGIPPENHPRIFDPLYTTGRSSGRSGLGMYVVYTIITRHLKGTIHIHEPEKGLWLEMNYPVDIVGNKPEGKAE